MEKYRAKHLEDFEMCAVNGSNFIFATIQSGSSVSVRRCALEYGLLAHWCASERCILQKWQMAPRPRRRG